MQVRNSLLVENVEKCVLHGSWGMSAQNNSVNYEVLMKGVNIFYRCVLRGISLQKGLGKKANVCTVHLVVTGRGTSLPRVLCVTPVLLATVPPQQGAQEGRPPEVVQHRAHDFWHHCWALRLMMMAGR